MELTQECLEAITAAAREVERSAEFRMADIWQIYGIKIRGAGENRADSGGEWCGEKKPQTRQVGKRFFLHRRPSFQSVFQLLARLEENGTMRGNLHGGQGAGSVRPAGFALPYLESAQAPEFYHFPGCYGGGQGLNEPACQFP
jgi:hypothetical protein